VGSLVGWDEGPSQEIELNLPKEAWLGATFEFKVQVQNKDKEQARNITKPTQRAPVHALVLPTQQQH